MIKLLKKIGQKTLFFTLKRKIMVKKNHNASFLEELVYY